MPKENVKKATVIILTVIVIICSLLTLRILSSNIEKKPVFSELGKAGFFNRTGWKIEWEKAEIAGDFSAYFLSVFSRYSSSVRLCLWIYSATFFPTYLKCHGSYAFWVVFCLTAVLFWHIANAKLLKFIKFSFN